jgi:hypothetical protein
MKIANIMAKVLPVMSSDACQQLALLSPSYLKLDAILLLKNNYCHPARCDLIYNL